MVEKSSRTINIFGKLLLLEPARQLMSREDFGAAADVSPDLLDKLETSDVWPALRSTAKKLAAYLKMSDEEFLKKFSAEPGMSCLIVRDDAAKAFRAFAAQVPELDESEILRQIFEPSLRMTPQKLKDANKTRLALKEREAATSKHPDASTSAGGPTKAKGPRLVGPSTPIRIDTSDERQAAAGRGKTGTPRKKGNDGAGP